MWIVLQTLGGMECARARVDECADAWALHSHTSAEAREHMRTVGVQAHWRTGTGTQTPLEDLVSTWGPIIVCFPRVC